MRVALVTISTSAAAGTRAVDASGDAIAQTVAEPPIQGTIVRRDVVRDDRAAIGALLRAIADSGEADAILTTGGTGLSPTDVTPEATLDVVERQAPGLAEAMRAGTASQTPLAWLSRGIAGTRGATLIVNLPGSPKAVRECLAVLAPLLPHAIAVLTGKVGKHDQPGEA
jgi:molybdopterin adenylyltransferase